jgi:hypothetical protein
LGSHSVGDLLLFVAILAPWMTRRFFPLGHTYDLHASRSMAWSWI